MDFAVEGRYFPNPLYAFTFAQIQADRMDRPVEVHLRPETPHGRPYEQRSTWHATAHPSNYVRRHLVKEEPGAPRHISDHVFS
mgnify:CR=1 FL=1